MVTPRWLAALLAAVKLTLQLIWMRPYGVVRDELYYLACARHLDFGYVDHPPLSIAVLRGWTLLFGENLSMRVVPAVCGALTVLCSCLLAIELGGGVMAVVLTAACLISGPVYLGMNHYFSMNSIDILLWPAAMLMVLRALKGGALRQWIFAGVLLGLGLENKVSVLWLGAGLGLALLATPDRAVLKTKGPWVCFAIALALFVPHLVWQVTHGFPTAEFARNALEHKYVRQPPWSFVAEAAGQVNPATALVWLPGLALAVKKGGRLRLVAVTFLAVAALLIATRAKAEYLAAGFPLAIALGGVVVGRWCATRRWLTPVFLLPVLVMGAIAAPFALPVLSQDRFIAYMEQLGVKAKSAERSGIGVLPQNYADTNGWEELTALVERTADRLTPEERPGAVVMVETNYGDAGALQYFGRGLPPVVCGHNNYWLWGPGDGDGKALIVVGGKRDELLPYFQSLEQTGETDCPRCMPYENHLAIWLGRGLKQPLASLWAEQKYYQ